MGKITAIPFCKVTDRNLPELSSANWSLVKSIFRLWANLPTETSGMVSQINKSRNIYIEGERKERAQLWRDPSKMEAQAQAQAVVFILPLLLVAAGAQQFDFNPLQPLQDLGLALQRALHPDLSEEQRDGDVPPPLTSDVNASSAAATEGNGGRRAAKRGARDFRTDYAGEWELFKESSGVSAMHTVITHKNKAIMFDATNWDSKLGLPVRPCRNDTRRNITDCFAHSLEFDLETGNIRPLEVVTNPWCASGGLSANGTLVQTGGWWEGGTIVRYIQPCEKCDWKEYPDLARHRWYATQQILPDGGFIVVGGRRSFNYEYVPPPGQPNGRRDVYNLPLLWETTMKHENNLYPFVHLSPDGNLFIFANNRSILLDPRTNKVVHEFPQLNGGARSYPGSGQSVLLPLNLNRKNGREIPAEVLVCGGAKQDAMGRAEKGHFDPALNNCGRLLITKPNRKWKMELMPKGRVMADMLLLPNADVLLVNGAAKGSAGWELAQDPVLEPWLYQPLKPRANRFKVLAPTTIPRVYHSSSAVMPNGQILVGGSNPNDGYYFSKKPFLTELRIEKFSPPYLDPALASHRPEIDADSLAKELKYGQIFSISFKLADHVTHPGDIKVTMYAQPFTTHGYSMNQRLLILKTIGLIEESAGNQKIDAMAPPTSVLAPPGYYVLFVVYRGVPSKGEWVHIQ